MLKVLNCTNRNNLKKLIDFLNKRRLGNRANTQIVKQILKDIKKNKRRAVIRYEKKFSKNSEINPSLIKINKSIKSLDPKIKNAIDFAYKRIFKFHSKQKIKNIFYKDKLNNKL